MRIVLLFVFLSACDAGGYLVDAAPIAPADRCQPDLTGSDTSRAFAGVEVNTVIEEGAFVPVLTCGDDPPSCLDEGVEYARQAGHYQRIGSWVTVWIDVAWTSTASQQRAAAVAVRPPYEPVAFDWVGSVSFYRSDFGTEGPEFTTPCLIISDNRPVIEVGGRRGNMDSVLTKLTFGDNESRRVVGLITYKTNGVFLY